jgi:hypothetical protein
MTALVFALQSDQVCIAMDTLVVGANDKMPIYFQRKFAVFPQNNLVVAGTGLANLICAWFSLLQSLPEPRDIDQINETAPSALSSLADSCPGTDVTTATLYHFGYSSRERQYVGYAYRSEHGFRSDRLQYALGYKPVVKITPADDIRFPRFLVDIVLEQQRCDHLLPISERVGIGGEIEFVVMSRGAIHVETVHRFSSYEAESIHIEQRAET